MYNSKITFDRGKGFEGNQKPVNNCRARNCVLSDVTIRLNVIHIQSRLRTRVFASVVSRVKCRDIRSAMLIVDQNSRTVIESDEWIGFSNEAHDGTISFRVEFSENSFFVLSD